MPIGDAQGSTFVIAWDVRTGHVCFAKAAK